MGFNADWLLRIGVAGIFLFHGISKYPPGPMMGFGSLEMTLVMLAEIGAGLLILVGAFAGSLVTRIGALLSLPVMIGAIAAVHWPRWNFVTTWSAEGPGPNPMGGMEFQVLLLLIALFFLIRGNGSASAQPAL